MINLSCSGAAVFLAFARQNIAVGNEIVAAVIDAVAIALRRLQLQKGKTESLKE